MLNAINGLSRGIASAAYKNSVCDASACRIRINTIIKDFTVHNPFLNVHGIHAFLKLKKRVASTFTFRRVSVYGVNAVSVSGMERATFSQPQVKQLLTGFV
jgi:hypothetical protein